MNLSLRLRCVRFYTFTHWMNLVVCLLDYEWLYGRDKSAPTSAVCSLLYIYALNEPCCVFVGLWMIVGRDKSAPTPAECSLIYIYAMNKPCCVFVGLWMMYGRDKSCPYAYGVFADIMQWINLVVCLLDYEWLYGRDKSAPTPTVCSLIYIYAMNRPCGMSVDIHFK